MRAAVTRCQSKFGANDDAVFVEMDPALGRVSNQAGGERPGRTGQSP
jgi:hypothetical protein